MVLLFKFKGEGESEKYCLIGNQIIMPKAMSPLERENSGVGVYHKVGGGGVRDWMG